MTATPQQVLADLARHRNVLLEGPPGTGKTHLLSEIVAFLRKPAPGGGQPTIKLGGATSRFGSTAASGPTTALPSKIGVEWVTFHQSYTYEDFVLGRRPIPQGNGIVLEPHLGLLMTCAVALDNNDGHDGFLLIIDEINRANASQVFGEFITLLEPTYRRTIAGQANDKALSVHLPGVEYVNGKSEPLKMLRGGTSIELADTWTFPEHIYVLAAMNSVDKAALPLDSALTRRFHRVEMRPDIELLAGRLNVDLAALAAKAAALRSDLTNIGALTAAETSVLLLDRLNCRIAADMGEDFELGHALLWSVTAADEAAQWDALIRAWDSSLFPQLRERFAGRPDTLRELLNVDRTADVYTPRRPIGGSLTLENSELALDVPPLQTLSGGLAQKTLRLLAL